MREGSSVLVALAAFNRQAPATRQPPANARDVLKIAPTLGLACDVECCAVALLRDHAFFRDSKVCFLCILYFLTVCFVRVQLLDIGQSSLVYCTVLYYKQQYECGCLPSCSVDVKY